jgi:hypothetical protein
MIRRQETTFGKQMMTDLFFKKIAGELEIPNTADNTTNAITTPTSERFLSTDNEATTKNEQGVRTNDNDNVKQRVDLILEQELDRYFKYITSIDYVELIKSYPSKLCNENTFKTDQVLILKDPINAAGMFDVSGWWQQLVRNKFKYLELCALIVLAKPIHNSFQECVFSRGTFTDDQLQWKMKELTLELSIL